MWREKVFIFYHLDQIGTKFKSVLNVNTIDILRYYYS